MNQTTIVPNTIGFDTFSRPASFANIVFSLRLGAFAE